MPRSADETRRRILDAAYELFYRKGFARIGVDAAAAARQLVASHQRETTRGQTHVANPNPVR